MATQAQSQGRYAVVNTLLDTTDVTLIDSLSGRQGDNGRIVYFAIKDGNLPHNLDGQNVVLTAKDSAGMVKQISGVHDMISATGGLFSMLIPGEMYQSAGDIEEAYISVQDGAGTVISSIPVTFTVLANNILFTANASKDYIDSVQQAINEANSRISGLNDNIKAQQLAYETLKTSVENLNAQVNSKQVAMLNVANHFTDTATFDKGVTAKTISTPNFKSDGTSIQQSRDGNTWHNLADDDGVVHKTGNEAISGDKTFTGKVTSTQPIDGALSTRTPTFTDFNDVAKNMVKYSGSWVISTQSIAHSPLQNYYTATITPGFSGGTDGYIELVPFAGGSSKKYIAVVGSGTLSDWKSFAFDDDVVHKTGTETIAGDKTFTGKITGVKKAGKLAASGYLPAMNYVYNDFMVQVTLAGGNSMVPVGEKFTLPSEIPAPAMDMTLNLGSGVLMNVHSDRTIDIQGTNLPGNFFQMLSWIPA
ncbi:BppU family phage baseplate upper protein [Weissella confusa]|uniref:BppU family phage baseplate upper protein n=1 Tax=Weissella confusa TaxID=1583 RepID=UPI0022E40A13|nr:BppU family phage baseplate upper protein [Weissella confusa]